MNAKDYSDRLLNYEKTLISWCIDGKESEIISAGIQPDMFHNHNLGKIFLAIIKANIEGIACDLVGIQKFLPTMDLTLLAVECTESSSKMININSFTKVVKEAALLRKNLRNLHSIYNDAVNTDPLHPYPLMERLSEIQGAADSQGGLDQFHGDLLMETLKEVEKNMLHGKVPAISTGMKSFDAALNGGIYPGHVITIAARPGGGKTTIAISMAYEMAKNGYHPMYVTVEMSSTEFNMKCYARDTGVPQDKIMAGKLNEEEFEKVYQSASKMYKWKTSVYSKSGSNWERVVMMIRNAVKYHGVNIVFLDYIQQYRMTKRLTQREELDIMAQQVKTLAQELNVPIIILSQLNREIEKRSGDADPKMSDIKESGTIEQASDAVLIITNDKESCDSNGLRHDGPWIVMVKNRWGQRVRWPVLAEFNINRFYE